METNQEPIKIVIGTFDGENMTDSQSKIYLIPQNYASKSKLVVGDELKLLIYDDGSHIFKQIRPVARKRVMGQVTEDMGVKVGDKVYNIILSSLTYFRAQPGDDAAILIPAEGDCNWAALENIIDPETY